MDIVRRDSVLVTHGSKRVVIFWRGFAVDKLPSLNTFFFFFYLLREYQYETITFSRPWLFMPTGKTLKVHITEMGNKGIKIHLWAWMSRM